MRFYKTRYIKKKTNNLFLLRLNFKTIKLMMACCKSKSRNSPTHTHIYLLQYTNVYDDARTTMTMKSSLLINFKLYWFSEVRRTLGQRIFHHIYSFYEINKKLSMLIYTQTYIRNNNNNPYIYWENALKKICVHLKYKKNMLLCCLFFFCCYYFFCVCT